MIAPTMVPLGMLYPFIMVSLQADLGGVATEAYRNISKIKACR